MLMVYKSIIINAVVAEDAGIGMRLWAGMMFDLSECLQCLEVLAKAKTEWAFRKVWIGSTDRENEDVITKTLYYLK